MGYSAFARVLTGWTGSIVVDGVTVTPRTRESVCSLFARVVRDVAIATSRFLTLDISSTGVVSLSSSSSFDMSATFNTATRTGFTGTYTGATSYTAAGAYSTAWVPANGLIVEGALLATTRGSAVGDGSGAQAPRRVSTQTQIVVWDSQLTLPAFADHDWDVWHGGRWFGRFVVRGVTREPMGPQRMTTNVRVVLAVTEVGAGEVVQTPRDQSVASEYVNAYMLGYVRSDVAGYRATTYDATPSTPTSTAGQRFDAYISGYLGAPDAVIWPYAQWAVELDWFGTVTFDDRIGWLMGFVNDPGTTITVSGYAPSRFVPPAAIPLIGATWTAVESDADRRIILDESLRNQGYAWGGALLWRCKLTMSFYALEALQTGWCLAGKVTLAPAFKLNDPISEADPQGAITGYVIGDPTVTWLDKTQTTAVVELTIASE